MMEECFMNKVFLALDSSGILLRLPSQKKGVLTTHR